MKRNLSFSRILEKDELREELFGLLRGLGIFAELSQDELLEVLKAMQHLLYSPGEVIFEQESKDRNLHLVLNGEVFLYMTRLGGSHDILARVGPQSSFGEVAFITASPRSASAMAGPSGSEHLVLAPAEFHSFLAHHPEITFKTMSGILSDIGKRAAVLPRDLANYAVWGYMRQPDPNEVERLRPTLAKRGVSTMVMFALGIAGGFLLSADLQRRIPEVVSTVQYFRPMCIGGLAFAGLILGFFLGTTWDALDRSTARGKRSDRCCMNCKYINWDDVDMSFRCIYKEMQMAHTKVELGEEFDTYTACPSFSFKGTAKVKMRERDNLSDGRD